MLQKAAATALALVLIAPALQAADPCPCVPLSHLWTVASCETWDCAQAALTAANGDPNIFVMPSASEEHRWLVLKRITAGSAAQSADSTFVIEQYPKMLDGSLRFDSIDGTLSPMLVTTFDHAVLVVYMRNAPARQRSTKH